MKKIFLILLSMSIAAKAEELTLVDKMKQLDTAVFDAFNQCENANALEIHASYFAENVEFYHDTGGVTWDRASMIANTKKYACGNYTRELVSGTFQTFPIKDFGMISQGTHIFCQTQTKQCEGKADFVMVWHNVGDKWEITRVLSYGHRTNN